MSISDNLKRGTIELMLLTLLKEGDKYGYELSQTLEERSDGLFTIKESTMYPTLYRLQSKGLISDRQEKVGARRTRVYYHTVEKVTKSSSTGSGAIASATASGEFVKKLLFIPTSRIPVSVTVTCDKNGN